MSDWQPIKTAPKDGTRVLGYFPQFVEKVQLTSYESSERYSHGVLVSKTERWLSPAFLLSLGGKEYLEPTHWMPLPEFPK